MSTYMKLKLSKNLKPRQFQLAEAQPGGHPNKVPFKCALFEVDKPSDGSPEGANGKRIRISSEICDRYIDTFIGMAFNIDYESDMRGHDTRFKVGVIEKAYRSPDGFAMVEGFLYGKDFPDVVATIRYYNNLAAQTGQDEYRFGASLEMDAAVVQAEDDPDVLDIVSFWGTGAAILFAEDAAFKNTSFAAKKSEVSELDEKQLKELLEGLKADLSASIEKVVGEVKTEVGAIKTEVESLKASSQKQPDPEPAQEQKDDAELKAAKEKLEKLEKELAELKAAKDKKPQEEPQRKTFSATQLLAKYGKEASEDMDYKTFCAKVDELNLRPEESLMLKLKAKQSFKKEE